MEVRGCDNLWRRANARPLDDTPHYLPELRDLISKLGAMWVIPEERLIPVVDVVWYLQLQLFTEHSAVLDTVEGFRKIQCVHQGELWWCGRDMVWKRWIKATVVEAVGWKANWSEKLRFGGGHWKEG
jgi:hypothetical protein